LFFTNICHGQIRQIKESIYYASDKFEISKGEHEKLNLLWDSVAKDSIIRIYIVGNTDNSADSLYNINLSKNRCLSVQDFFKSKQVATEVYGLNYYGENKPIATNIDEAGKQQNRRVDIRITYFVKSISSNNQLPLDNITFDTCEGADTLVILENGTQIMINMCDYQLFKDCYTIKSILTTDEIIAENVGLQTDDNIGLITCGMVNICRMPNCGSDTLPRYPITVRFPFPNNDSCIPCANRQAQVFRLNKDGNWRLTENRRDKIRIINIDGRNYYQMEVILDDKCVMVNCDCKPKPCSDDRKVRKKTCTKIKFKLPHNYKLIYANIYTDCPTTIILFKPNTKRLIKRNNIAKQYTKCYKGEHRLNVLAINPTGDTVQIRLALLNTIKHRVLFSKCKSAFETDNQKVFGLFKTKKPTFYRKYIFRKGDFL